MSAHTSDQDSAILAERIDQLTEENSVLRQERDKARRVVKRQNYVELATQILIGLAVICGVVLVCGVIIYPVYKMTTASTVPSHCFVQRGWGKDGYDNSFNLVGKLEWHPDLNLGMFPTIDDALNAAQKLKCPLGR